MMLPLNPAIRLIAEDRLHDWNFQPATKTFTYYTRFANRDTWILLRYTCS